MLSAFIFLILQANLLPFIQSICLDNGNYKNNSTYRDNLNTVLSSLPVNIDRNGFYYASVGENPDRANAIAMCRGDVQLPTCRECIQNIAAGLLTSCPNQKQAIDWYLEDIRCMLRYSNETILGTLATSPKSWVSSGTNATSYDKFKADLRRLLDNLRGRAAYGGTLRKVAAGNVTGPDFQSIYALVQCTPDLSPENCIRCLTEAALEIPICCDGMRGGSVLLPSCILGFETFSFYNETRLQELAAPPGEGDGNNTTRSRIVIIIVVSIVACVILALFVGILLRKRIKRKPRETPETVDDIRTTESLKYALSTIRDATYDFSNDNKLGQGGFGTVYKGKLPNGEEIAVKRLSKDSGQGDLEFKNEVLLLAKLQHRNLVRLLGFCLEAMEKLLIYEFVQNASLDLFIFVDIWPQNTQYMGNFPLSRMSLALECLSWKLLVVKETIVSDVGRMSPQPLMADFSSCPPEHQTPKLGSYANVTASNSNRPNLPFDPKRIVPVGTHQVRLFKWTPDDFSISIIYGPVCVELDLLRRELKRLLLSLMILHSSKDRI
ncbi:hypothetical protein DH2020_017327 [Rehmannia glutinosa]|uniref:Cysteine-rich receptor-like protein kinase n=1 Tax=Rehmannia glutinosa TaxID=99300 RepID=A0ABR0WTX7_REHGL